MVHQKISSDDKMKFIPDASNKSLKVTSRKKRRYIHVQLSIERGTFYNLVQAML